MGTLKTSGQSLTEDLVLSDPSEGSRCNGVKDEGSRVAPFGHCCIEHVMRREEGKKPWWSREEVWTQEA